MGTQAHSVSVVIPCFNAGEFLNEAVQSALAQAWHDLEVVIVDDGSTDAATLRTLEESRWPRTRVFHQPNSGPAAARNRAIREARGTYILPLDADDTIDPSYVKKAVAVLKDRPDVGCVYCRAMKFGAETGPWELPPYRPEELAVDNVIFVTALFRKEDWRSVGGFDEHLRHGVEDYDFWVKLVASGKDVVQLDEFLFNYRVQDKSRTTRFQDGADGKVATYAAIFRNNLPFYASHAETMFRHRFDLYEQIDNLRIRCECLEREAQARAVIESLERTNLRPQPNSDVVNWVKRYGKLHEFLEHKVAVRSLARRFKSLVAKRKSVSVRDGHRQPPTVPGREEKVE